MALHGIEVVARFETYCWNCGGGIKIEEGAFQGDDDHTYCDACYDAVDAVCSRCDAECGGH